MKAVFFFILLCFVSIHLMAQAPQVFKYQAVARNGSGEVLANKSVTFRISILQGSVTGTQVYSELHSKTTNGFGLVDLEIGKGNSPSGSFEGINWSAGTYFMKVELDPAGGTAYQTMGTSQLLSVPYALSAKNAENGFVSVYSETDKRPVLDANGHFSFGKPAYTWPKLQVTGSVYVLPFDDWGTTLNIDASPLSGGDSYSLNSLSDKSGEGAGKFLIRNSGYTSTFIMDNSGHVGIGLTNPAYKLDVKGDINFSGSLYKNGSLFGGEANWSDITGKPTTLKGYGITDADTSNTNEIQALSLNGSQLSLSKNGGTVTLPTSGTGGDNWGTQTVSTDATLTGNGLVTNPVKIAPQGATSGQVLKWDGSTWKPGNDLTGSGGGVPGGSSGQVQFNNNGTFGGDTNLVWSSDYKHLFIGNLKVDAGLSVYKSLDNNPAIFAMNRFEYGTGIFGVQGHSYEIPQGAIGVYGCSLASSGVGVWGIGGDQIVENGYGVKGSSRSSSGIGIYGEASMSGGVNYGVYGKTASTNGYSGYFTGGKFYVSGNVGIGTNYPAALLELKGVDGPKIVINDADAGNGRPGIQFLNNSIHVFEGDDLSDKTYGFYSIFKDSRNYNSRINVYGKSTSTSTWGRCIGISHDGTDGILDTDVGDIVINPASGNVGIGTATPSGKLAIRNGTYGGLVIDVISDNTSWLGSYTNIQTGNYAWGVNDTPSNLVLQGKGGNVGIGNSSPAYKLTVNGTAWCSSGTWTGSDIRWKKNISNLNNILPGILKLQAVNYNLRTDEFPEMGFTSERQIGLIAQDVEKVFPLLVTTDVHGFKAVAYDRLSALLVEGLKELKAENDRLKAENEKQRSGMEAIESRLLKLERLLETVSDRSAASCGTEHWPRQLRQE